MARPAVHEQVDHPPGLARKVWFVRSERVRRRGTAARLVVEHRGKREGPESAPRMAEEIATILAERKVRIGAECPHGNLERTSLRRWGAAKRAPDRISG